MVGQIVNQHEFQVVAVGKLHHPVHELCSKARVFGSVIEVDYQLANVNVIVLVGVPPLLETIGHKIIRLA